MDPLSIIAAVTGILAAAAKIANSLFDFIGREQNAPDMARSIVAEVTNLRLCLAQLAPFLHNMEAASQSRKAAISVESVVVISTSCVLTMSELEKVLNAFKLDQPLSRIMRLRWARQEQKINSLVSRVRESRSSLSLILTILTCETTADVRNSVEGLATSVDSILQSSKDMTRRLANMELDIAGGINDAATSSPRSPDITDTASTITIRPSDLYHQSMLPSIEHSQFGLNPDLQYEIYNSRVYSRTWKRRSFSSIPSSIQSGVGWSFFSGLSLSQISTISVISLPVSLSELWNSQHYSVLALDVNPLATGPICREDRDLAPGRIERNLGKNHLSLRHGMHKQSLGFECKEKRPTKMLLLGATEAGKTTLLKQMRLIYAPEPFSLNERNETRQIIFANVLCAFQIIFIEMPSLGLSYQNDNSKMYEQTIYEASLRSLESKDFNFDDPFYTSACLTSMKELWRDEAIQIAVLRGGDFALHDNLEYYMRNIDRLFSINYLPTDQDVLHASVRTTGVIETLLYCNEIDYHIFDVGGPRRERKKWVHAFGAVNCLIFVAALGAFDSCLIECKEQRLTLSTKTQMKEAELLFQSLTTLKWFVHVPIFLFLNKTDLLHEKLERKHVVDEFPNDATDAKALYAQRFRDMDERRSDGNRLHVYHTDATDTESLRSVFDEVFRIAAQHAQEVENLV